MEFEQTTNIFGGCPPNDCDTIQEALHDDDDDSDSDSDSDSD
jgi:hypothetical protein